jgi:hypothetical protein
MTVYVVIATHDGDLESTLLYLSLSQEKAEKIFSNYISDYDGLELRSFELDKDLAL